MKCWLVERPKDRVIVTIMRNKFDNTYSFVNITKEHICPCKFKSAEEALVDMDKKIEAGEIKQYREIYSCDKGINI